jgi:ankyrin repeat protein
VVKFLIESGANLNTQDINGITPLHVAINRKNDLICDYLLEQGAQINVIDK